MKLVPKKRENLSLMPNLAMSLLNSKNKIGPSTEPSEIPLYMLT